MFHGPDGGIARDAYVAQMGALPTTDPAPDATGEADARHRAAMFAARAAHEAAPPARPESLRARRAPEASRRARPPQAEVRPARPAHRRPSMIQKVVRDSGAPDGVTYTCVFVCDGRCGTLSPGYPLAGLVDDDAVLEALLDVSGRAGGWRVEIAPPQGIEGSKQWCARCARRRPQPTPPRRRTWCPRSTVRATPPRYRRCPM
jgi:hypothetical protein